MQRTGLVIRKKSAALLQVINLYSPKGTYDRIFLSNYATINVIDRWRASTASARSQLFGPLNYSMRIWLDPDKLTEFNLSANDIIAAVQSQNVQAAIGRIGAAPLEKDPAPSAHHKDQGAARPTPRNSPTLWCVQIPMARSSG